MLNPSADRRLPQLKINCAVCKKPVDRWLIEVDHANRRQIITVHCHGEKDTMIVDLYDMRDPVLAKQMMAVSEGLIEGTAFTQKRLAEVV